MLNDFRYALDPVAWITEKLRLDLDPVQRGLVASRGRRDLLNCTRKFGKTTTIAAVATHEANYIRGSKTVVVAPSGRQSSILLDTVGEFAEVGQIRTTPLKGGDPGLVFPSGVLIALPGAEATTRGLKGTTWLVVDEAARVPDQLFYAIRPFLANTNGRMTLMSTPFGKRGFFYTEHESGRWTVTKVTAPECPRISPEFLAEERLVLPDAWFRQEYMCEFTSVDRGVFDHDAVMASLSGDVDPLCL